MSSCSTRGSCAAAAAAAVHQPASVMRSHSIDPRLNLQPPSAQNAAESTFWLTLRTRLLTELQISRRAAVYWCELVESQWANWDKLLSVPPRSFLPRISMATVAMKGGRWVM